MPNISWWGHLSGLLVGVVLISRTGVDLLMPSSGTQCTYFTYLLTFLYHNNIQPVKSLNSNQTHQYGGAQLLIFEVIIAVRPHHEVRCCTTSFPPIITNGDANNNAAECMAYLDQSPCCRPLSLLGGFVPDRDKELVHPYLDCAGTDTSSSGCGGVSSLLSSLCAGAALVVGYVGTALLFVWYLISAVLTLAGK